MSDEEKTDYPKLKAYLSHEYDFCDEHTMREVVDRALRDVEHKQNIGIFPERLKHNEREKAFHDEWMKENDPVGYINAGHGILQDLFIISDQSNPLRRQTVHTEINSRDRMIAATVIQWLGSNCGMSFLDQALKRCGHTITKIK